MALQNKLIQKMSQTMLLTPQLRQSLEMLLLNHTELNEKLEQELLENPFLETTPEDHEQQSSIQDEEHKPLVESKVDWESFLEQFHDHGPTHGSAPSGDSSEQLPGVEANRQASISLQDHLLAQLRLGDYNEKEFQIASYIIGNVNRDGYLCLTKEEICENLKTTEKEVCHAIGIVQTLEPEGVAAENLAECLCLQLERIGLENSLAATIVKKHLPLLQERKIEKIALLEKALITDVQAAIQTIRSLEPRPGRPFYDDTPSHVVPDIYVKKVGDQYVISLAEDNIPRLRVSPYYLALMKDGNGEHKSFVNERLKAASWLIKSIYQRRDTIYRVTESIVKFQRPFLDNGVNYLRPLILKDVAADVGLHESTISRVTTNKYVDTPQGVYELKFFFMSGVKTSGADISSTSLKKKIKELILSENKNQPLSDQQICALLSADKVNIARRTVAKYREEMSIPPSSQRKGGF